MLNNVHTDCKYCDMINRVKELATQEDEFPGC